LKLQEVSKRTALLSEGTLTKIKQVLERKGRPAEHVSALETKNNMKTKQLWVWKATHSSQKCRGLQTITSPI